MFDIKSFEKKFHPCANKGNKAYLTVSIIISTIDDNHTIALRLMKNDASLITSISAKNN